MHVSVSNSPKSCEVILLSNAGRVDPWKVRQTTALRTEASTWLPERKFAPLLKMAFLRS